jgi:hypothetical protein
LEREIGATQAFTPRLQPHLIFRIPLAKGAMVDGQSIKDAAKKKPTYIIEQDGTLVRPIYENIWNGATVVI